MDLFNLDAKLTVDTSDYTDGIDEAGKETDNLSASSVAFGTLAAQAFEKVVSALGNLLSSLVSVAAETETAFAQLETISGTENIDSLTSALTELSSESGIASSELAITAYNAISAGTDAADAADMVEAATKLATAGFTDSSSALSVLTTIMNAYGYEADDVTDISDSLVQVQNLGVTTIDELASSMGKAISTASAYNVNLGNLESAYVSLTKAGISTEESTTYLSSMLNELGDSSSDVATIITEQTGKSFAELMDEGYSLGDVMGILYEACGEDATALMNLWSSAEAGKASNAIVSQGLEEFNENLQSITSSAGATEEAYETMAETSEYSFTRMKTSMTNLGTAIGNDLNPILATLADGLSAVLSWITNAIENFPALTALISGIAAAIVVATVAVAAMTVGLKALKKAITAVTKAIEANPMTSWIAAISAVVAGVTTLIAVLAGNVEQEEAEISAQQQLADAIAETTENYQALKDEIEENKSTTEDLVDELDALLDADLKTEAVEERIIEIVDELNELLPDLGLEYDSVTDSINMTTDAILDMNDAQAEDEEYLAALTAQGEAYDEMQEAAARVAEAEENLQKTEAMAAEQTLETTDNYTDLSGAVSAAQSALAEEQEMLEAATETYNEATGVVEAYAEATEEEMVSADYAAETAIDNMVTSIEELNTAYAESYDAALESLSGQFDLWDEVSETAATSSEDIMAALESQTQYWEDYSANLEDLNSRNIEGLDEFVAAVADGSEDSAAYIAGLAEMSDEELRVLIEETYPNLVAAQESAADSIAEMDTDYSDAVEEIVEATEEEIEGLDLSDEAKSSAMETLRGYVEGLDSEEEGTYSTIRSIGSTILRKFNSILGINSPSTEFKSAGENTIQGYINGVENKSSSLYSKMQSIASSALSKFKSVLGISSPSKEMLEAAGYSIEGFLIGLEQGESDVEKEMQSIAETAIGAMATEWSAGLGNISTDFASGTINLSDSAVIAAGNSGAGVTVVQNIYSQAQTAADLLREARWEQERAVLAGV